jgi:uncharacterized protein YbaR (Trm112 family)
MTGTGPEAGGTGEPAQDTLPRRADPKVLQMLVCPLTKTPLHYDEARQELISRAARLAYPIRDGIPIMMAEEARAVDDDELRGLGKR